MVAIVSPWEAARRISHRPSRTHRIARSVLRIPVVLFWFAVVGLLVLAGQWDALHRMEHDAGGRKPRRN